MTEREDKGEHEESGLIFPSHAKLPGLKQTRVGRGVSMFSEGVTGRSLDLTSHEQYHSHTSRFEFVTVQLFQEGKA